MDPDATMKFVTNLDREGIEAKLAEVVELARIANMDKVASTLAGVAGLSREEIEQRVNSCLDAATSHPSGRAVAAHLELVLINLPNLK